MLEKRQQFKEATKNLLVFVPEEQAPKEKGGRRGKVCTVNNCWTRVVIPPKWQLWNVRNV